MEPPLEDIVHTLVGPGRAATSAENNDRFRNLANDLNLLESTAKARRRALLMASTMTSVLFSCGIVQLAFYFLQVLHQNILKIKGDFKTPNVFLGMIWVSSRPPRKNALNL